MSGGDLFSISSRVVISNLDKLSQQSNEVPNQDLSLANQDVSFNYVLYICYAAQLLILLWRRDF